MHDADWAEIHICRNYSNRAVFWIDWVKDWSLREIGCFVEIALYAGNEVAARKLNAA